MTSKPTSPKDRARSCSVSFRFVCAQCVCSVCVCGCTSVYGRGRAACRSGFCVLSVCVRGCAFMYVSGVHRVVQVCVCVSVCACGCACGCTFVYVSRCAAWCSGTNSGPLVRLWASVRVGVRVCVRVCPCLRACVDDQIRGGRMCCYCCYSEDLHTHTPTHRHNPHPRQVFGTSFGFLLGVLADTVSVCVCVCARACVCVCVSFGFLLGVLADTVSVRRVYM